MLRLERHEDSRSNDRDDGNRTRDISQSCFARMLNTAIAATSIVFRMIPFAFESLNERITDQCKPLDKIRLKRMSLLALMVGFSILQPCNSLFVSDSIDSFSYKFARENIRYEYVDECKRSNGCRIVWIAC